MRGVEEGRLASRSRSTAARPTAKSASATWAYSRAHGRGVVRVASAAAARIARSASQSAAPLGSSSAGRWCSVSRTSRATSATSRSARRPAPLGPLGRPLLGAGRPSYTPSWNHAARTTGRRSKTSPAAASSSSRSRTSVEVQGVVVAAAGVGVRRQQLVAQRRARCRRGASGRRRSSGRSASSARGSGSVCSTTSDVTARVRHT